MKTTADRFQLMIQRSPIAQFLLSHFFEVMDRHAPPTTAHVLNRKKLYIYPSIRGHAFLAILLVIWLLGTNYQNNLILGLAFMLTSVFIVTILTTHNNLSGLSIEYVGAAPAFAGEDVDFIFCLKSTSGKNIDNLEIGWQLADDRVVNVDVSPLEPLHVRVPERAIRRGWQKPGRMLIQSYFPLGILRCWSWLNWDVAALIYPCPVAHALAGNKPVEFAGDGEHPVRGGEDYSGLRDYQSGDSLKHIAWRTYAQEKGLYVKEFSQNVSQERWLVFEEIPLADYEERLSAMCYWSLVYSNQDEYFGMQLPGKIIAPDKGENHRRQVLEALALFGE